MNDRFSRTAYTIGVIGLGLWMFITQNMLRSLRSDVSRLEASVCELQHRPKDVQLVTVTAYTASKRECDTDPGNTATMETPVPGWTAAVSRDLLRDGWVFGSRVWIEGVGVFEISDVMHSRFERRIDVLVGTKKQARKFGAKHGVTAVRIRRNA